MMRAASIVAVVAAWPAIAVADDGWQDDGTIRLAPIAPPDDLGSGGPITTHELSAAATYEVVDAPARGDIVHAIGIQLRLGPLALGNGHARRIFGDAFRWLERYSVRARWSEVLTQDGSHRAAPLTLALHRYLIAEPFELAPLVHIHAGITATLSTPWLGGRSEAPPVAMTALHAVDTELSDNGFSIRPGGYVRADLVLCRNKYLEAGIEPELFVPTRDDRATSYLLRYHVAIGTSLRCSNDPLSVLRPLTLAYELRARARLYADDVDGNHRTLHALALQYGFPRGIVVAASVAHGLGDAAAGYTSVGITLQFGIARRDP
jgi:hypothetical protein